MKRDLVSIEDLSNDDVLALLDRADEMAAHLRERAHLLRDTILATLFLEPSTRTRLSFEAAMHRLGGRVITSADPASSSTSKGETLMDTIRMVDGYADVIVLRHAAAGAALVAAGVADAPVINAGDGGREHPTQTLVDLFTLRRERGRLPGLTVLLYGDLRYGRTTHSLARALARFGGRVLALAEPGLELPDYVIEGLGEIPGVEVASVELDGVSAALRRPRLSTLIAPGAAAFEGRRVVLEAGELDAIYATRIQRERLPQSSRGAPELPRIDAAFLASPATRSSVVMHPLPRVTEIDVGIDADPRAAYFRQAAAGVPVRMAVLAAAMGDLRLASVGSRRREANPADLPRGVRCAEPACISTREPAATPPRFRRSAAGTVRCLYCENAAVQESV